MGVKKLNEVQESAEEAKFDIKDLFFSHTDKRGRIIYGNDVFVTISEYTSEELMGKPHNIIRHPSMPKCVFKLFWSYLLDGKPIAAYVKNKSKSGKYYWVMALAFPFQEGFLSIRLKPVSPLLKKVMGLYQELLSLEQKKSVEAAEELLGQRLEELGFSDYNDFMVSALATEQGARRMSLQNLEEGYQEAPYEKTFAGKLVLMEKVNSFCKIVEEEKKELEKIFDSLHYICLNLVVSVENYGDEGAALAVAGMTFNQWREEIMLVLKSFIERQKSLDKGIAEARLFVASTLLLNQMSDAFKNSEDKQEDYVKALTELSENNMKETRLVVRTLNNVSVEFNSAVKRLKESIFAIRILQITCKIESAHLHDEGAQAKAAITEIETFLAGVDAKVDLLEKTVADITQEAGKLAF